MTPSLIRFGQRQRVRDEIAMTWGRVDEGRGEHAVNFGDEWILSFSSGVSIVARENPPELRKLMDECGISYQLVSNNDHAKIDGYPEDARVITGMAELIISAEVMPPPPEVIQRLGKGLVELTEDLNDDGVGFYDHSGIE